MQNIGLTSLLFLSNIETIEWKSKTKRGKYFKRTKKIFSLKNVKKVEIFLKNDEIEIVERYIVFKKNIYIDTQKLKIEIAFKIDKDQDNNDIIVPIKNSKLVVFFTTEKITFLNFLIQGPFKTTPNR